MLAKLWQDETDIVNWTADVAHSAGDVIQLRDGRAGVVTVGCIAGQVVGVYAEGLFRVAKTASMVMLNSSKLFWDYSANAAHLLHGNDRDFYLGECYEDATSAATDVLVNLNVQPVFTVGLDSGFASIRVQTAGFVSATGAGSQGCNLAFDTANEAQKVDALSHRGLAGGAVGAEGILHALICVVVEGNNAVCDMNVGIANGTHASDADAITEHMFAHFDGAAEKINIQSKDGTTTVAATDTTLVFVAGTPFLVQFDMRDPTDIQAYVNGVLVLPSTVFKLNNAVGPLKFLAHMEKSANATPGNLSVLYGGIVTAKV